MLVQGARHSDQFGLAAASEHAGCSINCLSTSYSEGALAIPNQTIYHTTNESESFALCRKCSVSSLIRESSTEHTAVVIDV